MFATNIIFPALVLISLINFHVKATHNLESDKFYYIQNADGSFLTINGGLESKGVIVITSPLQPEMSSRQRFGIGKGGPIFPWDQTRIHEIRPEQQNSTLKYPLLIATNWPQEVQPSTEEEIDVATKLVNQQRWRNRATQYWAINEWSDGKWSIENNQYDGYCLSSQGINSQVYVAPCDTGSQNQTWIFKE